MSDVDLLARLRNFEDQFVERKVVSDSKDWTNTVVAFANSAPIGLPCILYIGVKDDGQFESRQNDFDSVQKTLNRMLQNIHPRAAYFPKMITDGSNQALAVIVPGSDDSQPELFGKSPEKQSIIHLSWAARANFCLAPNECVLDGGLFAEHFPCQPSRCDKNTAASKIGTTCSAIYCAWTSRTVAKFLPGNQYPVSLKNASWYPIALTPVQNIAEDPAQSRLSSTK